MTRTFMAAATALLLALGSAGSIAQAQGSAPAAAATTSNDPIVQERAQLRKINAAFNKKRDAATRERMVTVDAAVAAAVAKAKAEGSDQSFARREARAKAMAETQPAFDERMKPAIAERDAARAKVRAGSAAK